MSAKMALGAPLALSLVGHAALFAVLAGAGLFSGRPPHPDAEQVVSVKRAGDIPNAVALRLRVEIGEPETGASSGESDTGASSGESDTGVIALESADPLYRPYLSGVKERIWERWSAPILPADRSTRGVLVVEFTLTRSGRLAASGVRETSGVPALDRAALAAVARAGPFMPLPAAIAGESLRVRARFVYD